MTRLFLASLLLTLAAGCSDDTANPNSAPDDDGDAAAPGDDGADEGSNNGDDDSLPTDDGSGSNGDDGDDENGGELTEPCNGHTSLCNKRFDEVVYPCTHNSFAAEEYGFGVLNWNQLSGLTTQLEDGVRCMMLDVYEQNGERVLCHGGKDLCFLGSYAHLDALNDIKAFLDNHPREVLTIIYQDELENVDAIAEDLASVGLDALAFTYDGSAFPTLGEMIAANKRLLVTLENGKSSHAYLGNVWDITWDTPYSFNSTDDFTCALNRGARENPLFLVNHWLSQPIVNLPDEKRASIANSYDVLYGRAKGCWDETGDVPNFVAVDFYEHGDLFRVVDALNGL